MYTTLGGRERLATQYVRLDLAINSVGMKRHNVSFFVVETTVIEMVLGFHYMAENEILEKLVAKKSSVAPKAFVIFSKKPSPGMNILAAAALQTSLTRWNFRTAPVHAQRKRPSSKKSSSGRSKYSSTWRRKNGRREAREFPNYFIRIH
jgi:hypothetical protein